MPGRAEQVQTGRHPEDQGPRQVADGTAAAQAAQATAEADALAEALQAARAAQQAAEIAAAQAAAALHDAREQAAAPGGWSGRTAAGQGGPLPAEEDVADSLHQMLAGDDTFALVAVFALAGVAGQHRSLGLSSSQHI